MKDNQRQLQQPSIIFLIPYFGKWPFWMDYFLQSCEANSSIDWLFYTDCGTPARAPRNTRFVHTEYQDYCQRVSERLGIDFSPPSAYKLCDIKPAMGYIHEADIQGYDFWAFGDIDVVYGDLRAYFNAERLAGKDLLATHHRRVSGHLCLLRNSTEMREAFMAIPDWRARYADPQHYALDEGAFSRLFVRHKNWPEWLRRFAHRFSYWYGRVEFIEAHSTYTLLPSGEKIVPEFWHWRAGHLTNSVLGEQELPYCHFMFWKNQGWSGKPMNAPQPEQTLGTGVHWLISAEGWTLLVAQGDPDA